MDLGLPVIVNIEYKSEDTVGFYLFVRPRKFECLKSKIPPQLRMATIV